MSRLTSMAALTPTDPHSASSIRVPRQQIVATVSANVPLCREHFRLELHVPEFPATQPGHFIQIACRDVADEDRFEEQCWQPGEWPVFAGSDLLGPQAVLRRPFSLAGRRDDAHGVTLIIIHRVVGVGTNWLANLGVGERVSVIGPLGNTFTLPSENGVGIFIGGGVGIPPMLYLAERMKSHCRAMAFCGATTRDLLPLTITDDALPPGPDMVEPLYNISEFATHGVAAVISTDDGSYGFRGYVTQALEQYLDRFFLNSPVRPTLYTCGPELMMKRVADIAQQRGLTCQIAVERAMACGMGTCQSCVIKAKTPDGWKYRLACTDGPVFSATDLMW